MPFCLDIIKLFYLIKNGLIYNPQGWIIINLLWLLTDFYMHDFPFQCAPLYRWLEITSVIYKFKFAGLVLEKEFKAHVLCFKLFPDSSFFSCASCHALLYFLNPRESAQSLFLIFLKQWCLRNSMTIWPNFLYFLPKELLESWKISQVECHKLLLLPVLSLILR